MFGGWPGVGCGVVESEHTHVCWVGHWQCFPGGGAYFGGVSRAVVVRSSQLLLSFLHMHVLHVQGNYMLCHGGHSVAQEGAWGSWCGYPEQDEGMMFDVRIWCSTVLPKQPPGAGEKRLFQAWDLRSLPQLFSPLRFDL